MGGVNPGNAVIYWMTSTRRTRWNHALQHSVNLALNLNSPLIVFEPLFISQKWACDRFHAFAIQGMLDNQVRVNNNNQCLKSSGSLVRLVRSWSAGPNQDQIRPAIFFYGPLVRSWFAGPVHFVEKFCWISNTDNNN